VDFLIFLELPSIFTKHLFFKWELFEGGTMNQFISQLLTLALPSLPPPAPGCFGPRQGIRA
jgi:hypothetical protein